MLSCYVFFKLVQLLRWEKFLKSCQCNSYYFFLTYFGKGMVLNFSKLEFPSCFMAILGDICLVVQEDKIFMCSFFHFFVVTPIREELWHLFEKQLDLTQICYINFCINRLSDSEEKYFLKESIYRNYIYIIILRKGNVIPF